LEVWQTEHARVLRFNRPAQLNAMNSEMMAAIARELDALEHDPAVRAIILTGAGRAFMAGADIKEYAQLNSVTFEVFQKRGRQLYERLEASNKLVIAAVNGYALGGGFEMVLAADLVVAQRDSKMGLPEVKLGLIPGGGGTQRLSRKLGPNRALELLVTGRARTAEELATWGLVNRLCEDNVVNTAEELAAQCSRHPIAAVQALKQLTRLAQASSLAVGLDMEARTLQTLYESEEGQSRILAFVRKSEAEA
jgi:enoyl-CoA hydratase/carnithine racemase